MRSSCDIECISTPRSRKYARNGMSVTAHDVRNMSGGGKPLTPMHTALVLFVEEHADPRVDGEGALEAARQPRVAAVEELVLVPPHPQPAPLRRLAAARRRGSSGCELDAASRGTLPCSCRRIFM